MRVINTIHSLRAYINSIREQRYTVGLVPTMGAFHEGHLALMRRSLENGDCTVVSLFVNPTQFGPKEDLEKYPRDFNRDSQLAADFGVHALFAPTASEMYPEGFQTHISLPKIRSRYEGEIRPGHFDGVAAVCAKLFNLVQPQRAYFGQKDYQQLVLIQRMVCDLNFSMEIVPVPTVREPDGLAMSSRNAYLSPEERAVAPRLYLALRQAAEMAEQGEHKSAAIEEQAVHFLAEEPLIKVDYIKVADAEMLEPADLGDRPAVILGAIRIGSTRLIDNILLK
ncbi:MAG: pantoate--beta-alanine ligase [Armatimonadetes bacterium]|nr:pantoate--beta-alanine ligase [Armatimonadota bacterium]